MTSNLNDLILKVRPYLRQYLLDNNVEIVSKGQVEFFKCINPDHPDRNPSNGFVKNTGDQQFHCFSCNVSGDILTAASLLENKPRFGIGFVKDNLEYLLKKYEIDYVLEYTEEQLVSFKYESVYEEAARLMCSFDKSTGSLKYSTTEHCESRGWNREYCIKNNIATVKDFREYIDTLSALLGINSDELQHLGIKPTLFGPDYITITIRDHKNAVKGFVSRYLKYQKGSDIPKYCNTSIADNPGYQKDRLLYCLNVAKKYNSLRLDIFEGYGSAIIAHQNNYHNCVAIGSTAFSEHHMEIIRDLGFQHINFVLDQDITGSDMMEKYIEKFSGYSGLQVTITKLPLSQEDLSIPGQNDPDYFIRTYGINKYRSVKPEGVFEHMLKKHSTSLDPESNPVFTINFTKQIIPLIINEPDMLERSRMISTLAKVSGFDKEDIRLEINRIEKTDVRVIKDDIARKLRNVNDPDALHEILSKSIDTIKDTGSTKNERYLVSLTESIEIFDSIFTDMISQPEGIHGWKTGFNPLDDLLDGVPKPIKGGVAIGFAGASQHGKSAAMLNLVTRLASNNNDIAVCYWAIDDHRKAIAYRLVSMLSGVPMKKVRNNVRRTPQDDKAIKEAQDVIRELIFTRKLVFKDDRYGRTKGKAETWIKETQDATGNHILFCIDSLHNVQGGEGMEARMKLLSTSTWMKSLCASVPATIMCTLELVKNKTKGEKPTLQSISESGKMEFDFDTLAIVWNEAQGNYCPVEHVQAKWGMPGNYKPIIELDFQKNKTGAGEKGSLYFKYDTETTSFIDCVSYQDYMLTNKSPSQVVGMSGTSYNFTRTNKKTEEEKPVETPSLYELDAKPKLTEW
jgi:replicative DNA helicase